MPAGEGSESTGMGVAALPASAQICSCNNVSKADICGAIDAGALEVADIKAATKAATTCGGCGRVQSIDDYIPNQERFELDMARVANLPEAAQRAPLRDWLPGRGYSEEFLHKALFPLMSLAVLTPEGYLDMPLALYSLMFSRYFSFFSTTTWRASQCSTRYCTCSGLLVV